MISEETRAKLKEKAKGRIPPSRLGSKMSDWLKEKLRIANWKGEEAGLTAKHSYLNYHYGKPRLCDFCQDTEAKKYDWANISGKYLRDRSDYYRLCRKCHIAFDNGRRSK